MLTKYTIFLPDNSVEPIERATDWPDKPDFHTIAAIIEPALLEFGAKNDAERVNVWLTPDFEPGGDGFYTDMFVDEMGLIDGLPRNDRATKIYRANHLTFQKPAFPETLPYIAGPAIVFHRRVWF